MKKALLVIDVQSFFLRHAPSDLADRITEHIENSKYDSLVFTVFKGSNDSNFERSLHKSGIQDDSDLEIPDSLLKFVTTENKFIKNTYSAFFDGKLDALLKSNSIKAVDICGVDLDACVLATAYNAFDHGYDTKVLYDLSCSRFELTDALKNIINRNIQSKNESR